MKYNEDLPAGDLALLAPHQREEYNRQKALRDGTPEKMPDPGFNPASAMGLPKEEEEYNEVRKPDEEPLPELEGEPTPEPEPEEFGGGSGRSLKAEEEY